MPSKDKPAGIPVHYQGKTFFRCRCCRTFELVTQDELEDGLCAFCAAEEANNGQ